MESPSKDLVIKMKRRIKRQIKTGNKSARVKQLNEKLFAYEVKHRSTRVVFRRDKMNRLTMLV